VDGGCLTLEPAHPRIVIVGGGFAGSGMAIRLKQRGIEDFALLERAEDVGGTWRYNTYPGCRCDVPSHLYSFSFAPNPEWTQTYSAQAEIREYLGRCADEHGIRAHVRTRVEMLGAEWSEDAKRWQIETSAGPLSAEVLVSCMGPLTEPKLPEVPGLERFEGKLMHSARWDHDYELAGKRVASIGTGASAIQYVPEIQPEVERLFVFQRTAPWVMPHGNRPIRDFERALFRRVPVVQRLVRAGVYLSRELLVLGFAKQPRLMRLLERLAGSHMDRQVTDPQLRERVRPRFALGCKRVLPSNRWYRALAESNVELVESELSAVTAIGVVDRHGVEREVDAIVFGTGFHVTDPPVAAQVRGRDGRLMRDAWEGTPRAYLGTSVTGFPNLFLLLGPNTGLGHSSMVYMIESQIEHVLAAIGAMDERRVRTIEVRAHAYDAYNREVDASMAGTVWEAGCSSFYIDATGRNSVLWPDWTWRFRRRAARFDPLAYQLGAGVGAAGDLATAGAAERAVAA
jgi:cation diffusion facilitator CzcD-associated flavoprotein CzcO